MSALERWQLRRDPHALHELVDQYSGMVYATCCRVLGDRTEAEDVAQECFVALAQSDSVRPDAVGGWLYAVAVRRCLYRRRSERRRREREMQYSDLAPRTVGHGDQEIYRHVDEAVEELPEELRTPLIAHYMEGQSHATIAKHLGIPRRTLSHRIERAVKQVGNALRRRGIVASGVAVGLALQDTSARAATAPATVRNAMAAWAELADGDATTSATRQALQITSAGAPALVTKAGVWRVFAKAALAACAVAVIGTAAMLVKNQLTPPNTVQAGKDTVTRGAERAGAEGESRVAAGPSTVSGGGGGGVGGASGSDSAVGVEGEPVAATPPFDARVAARRAAQPRNYYESRGGAASGGNALREMERRNVAVTASPVANLARSAPRRLGNPQRDRTAEGEHVDATGTGSGIFFTIDDRLVGETPAAEE